MKKLNKKGFTLIELLAVIIILGILMIIAIPSVTTYIQNSRKSAYVDTANAYITAVRNETNSGNKLKLFDPNTLYLVPVSQVKNDSCVSVESGGQSPYDDEWTYAFVGVKYDGKGYTYYFVAEDASGQGIAFSSQEDLSNKGNDLVYSSRSDGDNGLNSDATKAKTISDALKGYYGLTTNTAYCADNTACKAGAVNTDVATALGGNDNIYVLKSGDSCGN